MQPRKNSFVATTYHPFIPITQWIIMAGFSYCCVFWLIFHLARSQPASDNRDLDYHRQLELRANVELTQVEDILTKKSLDWQNATTPGPPAGNVSQQCQDDFTQYELDLSKEETYAMLMFEASGKLPIGLPEGKTKWLGSYSECTRITRERFVNITFDAQYYLVYLRFGAERRDITHGMCVPGSCSSWDMTIRSYDNVFYRYLLDRGILKGIDVQAIENEPIQSTTIAAICICSCLGLLLSVATMYDVFIHQPGIASAKKTEEDNKGDDVTTSSFPVLSPDERTPLIEDASNKGGKSESANETGMAGHLLLCFSLYTNIGKLLSTKQAPGSIRCLHGIRFLSMSWVIMGHTFQFVSRYLDNGVILNDNRGDFTSQAIANSSVSVDSFFLLSGILMCYVILQQMQKSAESGKRVPFGMMYLHRYLRLTPTYLFALMLYMWVYPYLSTGPLSPTPSPDPDCGTYWWRNMLYIHNFYETREMCMSISWYLSNDMQFFVIGVPLVYILFRWRHRGLAPIVILLLASLIATAVLILEDEPTTTKPYCRIGPYLVGMAVGWLLLNTKGKIKKNLTIKFLAAVCWAVATASALAVLYGLYGTYHGTVLTESEKAFYYTVRRTVWGMALGWVVIACYHGFGGPVNTILSWDGFVPLSRLTYCAYLTNYMVVSFYYKSRETLLHYTTLTMIYIFLGNLVISYGLAFLVSVAVEAPLMGLEKLIFKK